MPFIVWTSGMSVDVKLLDNDHKKLAILINDLHDGVMTGCARESLERIFDELVAYSRLHFAHEEQFLVEAGYSGAAAHKQEHEHKIEQVIVMQARFRSRTELAGQSRSGLRSGVRSTPQSHRRRFNSSRMERAG